MKAKTIGGIKRLIVKQGKEEEFEQLFSEMLSQIRASESGNIYYDLFKSSTVERGYIVLECYRDKDAWQVHQDSSYGKIYFPKIRAILDEITVEYFDS